MYREGRGVPKDEVEAQTLSERAGELRAQLAARIASYSKAR